MPIIEISGAYYKDEMIRQVSLPDETGKYHTPYGELDLVVNKVDWNSLDQSTISIQGEILKGYGKHKTRTRRKLGLTKYLTPEGKINLGRGRTLKVRLLERDESIQLILI